MVISQRGGGKAIIYHEGHEGNEGRVKGRSSWRITWPSSGDGKWAENTLLGESGSGTRRLLCRRDFPLNCPKTRSCCSRLPKLNSLQSRLKEREFDI